MYLIIVLFLQKYLTSNFAENDIFFSESDENLHEKIKKCDYYAYKYVEEKNNALLSNYDMFSEIVYKILFNSYKIKNYLTNLVPNKKVRNTLINPERYMTFVNHFIQKKSPIRFYSPGSIFLENIAIYSHELIEELGKLNFYYFSEQEMSALQKKITNMIDFMFDKECPGYVLRLFRPTDYNHFVNFYNLLIQNKKIAIRIARSPQFDNGLNRIVPYHDYFKFYPRIGISSNETALN